MKTMTYKEAFYAALAADDAYSAELTRVYGPNRAGTERYRFSHADALCNAAMIAKQQADMTLHTLARAS